jgi:hypothetical protein
MDHDTLYVLICEQLPDEIIAAHDDFIFQWCKNLSLEHSIDLDVAELVETLLKLIA